MKTLENLFLDALADMYYAENQLVKALATMAKTATDEDLSDAFELHLAETERQVEKLEQVFAEFGEKARPKNARPSLASSRKLRKSFPTTKNPRPSTLRSSTRRKRSSITKSPRMELFVNGLSTSKSTRPLI